MDASAHYLRNIMPSVPGWLSEIDAFLFQSVNRVQKRAGVKGHLVEVGVYCGKCLGLLATFRGEGEGLFGLDLFTGRASLETTRETLVKAAGNAEVAQLLAVNSLTMPDAEIRALVKGPVRFLHVDGGHEYEEALSDLRKFGPLLGEGGVIAVDDYYNRDFPGVAAATADYTKESGLVPFLAGRVKMYLCAPQSAEKFIPALLENPTIRERAHVARFRGQQMLVPFAPKELLALMRADKGAP